MPSPLENVPSASSGLADAFESALDSAAGRTDEATHGVLEDAKSGRWYFAGQEDAGAVDHALGSADESLATGADDRVIDTLFGGHAGDTVDVVGPTTGEVADVAVEREGESRKGETKTKLWLAAGGLVAAAVVFRPYADAAATAAEGGDD